MRNGVLGGISDGSLLNFDRGSIYLADGEMGDAPTFEPTHTGSQTSNVVLAQIPRSEMMEWVDQRDMLDRIKALKPRSLAWNNLTQVLSEPACSPRRDVKEAIEATWMSFGSHLYNGRAVLKRYQVTEEPHECRPPDQAKSMLLTTYPSNLTWTLGAWEVAHSLDVAVDWEALEGRFTDDYNRDWRSVDMVRDRFENNDLWDLLEPSIRRFYCSLVLREQLVLLARLRRQMQTCREGWALEL
ncbi:hypothetical protein N0V84_001438 [Fusarium piperis]|uniref:Uncharacterized protein n=1 Tax=Fusarium piperis TaxID=1435070 RepID=A0A9W9BU90_9HYPO|nr:hypothetical protein N0V84_001438 [Fusarium piperis]